MSRAILLFAFLLVLVRADGQPIINITNLDSLKNELATTNDRLEALYLTTYIAEILRYSEKDTISSYIEKAYEIFEQITEKEEKEEAFVIIIEAVLSMNIDSFITVALQFVENPTRRARIFLELHEYRPINNCLSIMDSVYYYLEKAPEEALLAEYYYERSNCYLYTENLLMALKMIVKAEEIVEEDHAYAPAIYNTLTYIYGQLKAHEKAVETALKAQRISAKQKHIFGEGDAIHYLNDAAFALGQFELIKENEQRFIELDAKLKGNSLSRVYIMLGKVAIEEGKLDEAEAYFLKGLNLEYKPDLDVSGCYAGLSRVWGLKNDWAKAKYYAEKSLETFDYAHNHDLSVRNRELAKVYANVGEFKTAFQLLENEINDRLKSDSIIAPYQLIETLLNDNFEQEKSILQKEVDFQKKWSKQNLFIGLASGAIIFMTFLFFYIRKRNANRTLELNRLVQEQTKEILDQKNQLQKLDQAKTRLYTNITHEFRTPLTVIAGITEQMKGDKENKQLIQRNTGQLLNLVNQMLDLRKLESGAISFQKIQGDIIPFLRYLTESLHSYAELQELSLHFLADEKSLVMDYDPEKITRIHSNLLSNAIKFTPKGGDVYVQIQIELQEGLPYLAIKVKDTGVGIHEEQLPYVFERFYQIDNSSTRQGEGTGIGLTLVAELAKALDGKMEVKSTIGTGSTFKILLPITNDATPDNVEPTRNGSNLSMVNSTSPSLLLEKDLGHTNKPIALIIEDNADVIHYLILCLKDWYTIEIAMDGEEGIEKAIEQVPNIIISDVMMPLKDGFEVCQTLKTDERTSHIPIILLTAKADMDARLEGLQRGADAYLNKPFHKEELLITLQNQLTLRKKLQTRFTQFEVKTSLSKTLTALESEALEIQLEIEDAFLQKIRSLIEKDLSLSDIGMPQLIRHLGMSRSQIYKKVKALTGHSPSVFIRSIRLYHAQQLLKNDEHECLRSSL